MTDQPSPQKPPLRRGWTTGSCAAAAAKAAWAALQHGTFPDPVTIPLPRHGRASFALAQHGLEPTHAWAAIVKDAGDDPDVTHGALIRADLHPLPKGHGIVFQAGEGVGTVTRPGLPILPGEPAINPVPRAMIRAALSEITPNPDVRITLSIPNGEELAKRTLNNRLGIVGGLSILGTTGIVIPFSCAAWIDTIHRGIDVARALNLPHIVGSTGDVSERTAQSTFTLPDTAMIEMGDFVGGLLKYLRTHPVPRLTIAGGPAKITKLAQGLLDLHSKRGTADMPTLAQLAAKHGAPPETCTQIAQSPTVAEAFLAAAPFPLAPLIAKHALRTARATLQQGAQALDILIVTRSGQPLVHMTENSPSP